MGGPRRETRDSRSSRSRDPLPPRVTDPGLRTLQASERNPSWSSGQREGDRGPFRIERGSMIPPDLQQKPADELQQEQAADPSPAATPPFSSVLLLVSVILLVKACQFGISGWRVSTLREGDFNPLWAQRDYPMFAWDSFHYRDVMVRGYPKPDSGVPSDIAFFPLYPLTAKALGFLGPEVALLLIANLASLAGLVLFYLWAYRAQGAAAARGALLLALAYPPAFFLSSAYTEGFFLLFFAATCWLLQRGKLLPAAGSSALATATRPTGAAIAALVVLWAILHGGGSGGRVRHVL